MLQYVKKEEKERIKIVEHMEQIFCRLLLKKTEHLWNWHHRFTAITW